jgi:hypothetical protein
MNISAINELNPNFKKHLLKVTQSSDCEEIEIIQTLWSGYGTIARYKLHDSVHKTVVVKCIALDQSNTHPRGWNTNLSHERKVKSYQVETHWYEKWNEQCTEACRTPICLGSYTEGENQWIILEDLNTHYPLRKQELGIDEVKVCLQWLAHFHATFLHQKPIGLWETGTYWHLETRPYEFEKIEHADLKAKAHEIDSILNQCSYQTIVHGDAKLANFCFSDPLTSQGDPRVAAVDFQYVGGGCGMKDVAYFLGSCLSSSACERYENELLGFYFSVLQKAVASAQKNINFNALEQEWRTMYPIACTDFTRFLLGWMPTHQKINNYNRRIMGAVLTSM